MRRRNNYTPVQTLSDKAMTVTEYAQFKGITKQALYNQIRRNKADGFKIVVFKGFNFVLET